MTGGGGERTALWNRKAKCLRLSKIKGSTDWLDEPPGGGHKHCVRTMSNPKGTKTRDELRDASQGKAGLLEPATPRAWARGRFRLSPV